MAKKKKKTTKRTTKKRATRKFTPRGESATKRLARKLGVAESTIRSRKTRGQKLDAKPQIRLTPAQMQRVARARGTTQAVADKHGVSVSTVKRLRRLYGTKR